MQPACPVRLVEVIRGCEVITTFIEKDAPVQIAPIIFKGIAMTVSPQSQLVKLWPVLVTAYSSVL